MVNFVHFQNAPELHKPPPPTHTQKVRRLITFSLKKHCHHNPALFFLFFFFCFVQREKPILHYKSIILVRLSARQLRSKDACSYVWTPASTFLPAERGQCRVVKQRYPSTRERANRPLQPNWNQIASGMAQLMKSSSRAH